MLKIEGPRRTVAASIAAVAVVALIVGLLHSANIAQGIGGDSGTVPEHPAPTQNTMPTSTPGPLGVTPGPQAKYIPEIVTAGGRSSDGSPTYVKSHFLVGDYVYVLAVVRGLPKGAHIISVAWYLNGVFVELPASAQTSQTIDGDKRVVFALQYPSSGLGAAKIYIDRPASDKSEDPKDQALADTIYFAVEMPTPAPTQQPGGPTPTPFVNYPTATPHQ